MRWIGVMAAVCAAGPALAEPLQVDQVGSLFVGGETISREGLPVREARFTATGPVMKIDPNGDYVVGGMYAQYVKLADPRAKYPLMLWHGGGLSGSCWETTPDGRPGWQSFFLHAGWDVYVSDAYERGRSGFPRYPDMVPDEPVWRTMKEAWVIFRFGPPDGWDIDPAKRKPFPGSHFPPSSVEGLAREAVPRWISTDARIQHDYDLYVNAVGPSVIVVHSQGGAFAMQEAVTAPERVKAVVAVEPSGAPDPDKVDAARVKNIPHLFVYGDHTDQEPWPKFRAAADRWIDAIRRAGGTVDVIDLPKQGITGNTHMMFQDDNSDQIAGLIQTWLAAHGMMK